MTRDPHDILDNEPMGRMQVAAVVVCILLCALDGFDVLAISFAAPGIAAEWGVNRAALGIVLSMELIGMGVGSILLGNVADRIGRRPVIFACLVVMSLGMALAATANDVKTLLVYRFATGIGIGGMLAAISAMAAEFSNRQHRSAAVAMMAMGYPIGVVVGGTIASVLLAWFDWRAVFTFGAVATALFIPIVWLLLPESISYLVTRRPAGALARINATLRRMGHGAIDTLPAPPAQAVRTGIGALFQPGLAKVTVLLTLAFFAHVMTFYFLVKWIPKIVVDMGYEAALAGSVLVWANVGGILGSLLLSLLTHRFDVRWLVITMLLLAAGTIVLFGQGQESLAGLSVVAGIAGAFTTAAIVGLYALFARSFPTHVRASGTGFAIGVGRGGAALGPILAGLLFAAGQGLATVAAVMACGSIVAVAALAILGRPVNKTAPQNSTS